MWNWVQLFNFFSIHNGKFLDPEAPTEPHEKKHKKQKRHEDDKSERKKRKKEKKRKKQRHTPDREQANMSGNYMNPGSSASGLFGNSGHMSFPMPHFWEWSFTWIGLAGCCDGVPLANTDACYTLTQRAGEMFVYSGPSYSWNTKIINIISHIHTYTYTHYRRKQDKLEWFYKKMAIDKRRK